MPEARLPWPDVVKDLRRMPWDVLSIPRQYSFTLELHVDQQTVVAITTEEVRLPVLSFLCMMHAHTVTYPDAHSFLLHDTRTYSYLP